MIALTLLAYAVFFAWACGWLADRKGYDNVTTWQILGLFFGVFALLVIGFSPEHRSGATEEYTTCPDCGLHVPEEFLADHHCT